MKSHVRTQSIEPALEVRGMTVSYGDGPVVSDVSFSVHPGEVMGLLGPNGSGKSTTLKATMGLIPCLGDARFFGEALRSTRREVAYMTQTATIDVDYPITVGKVVEMGVYPALGWWQRLKPSHHAAIDDAVSRMGLDNLRHKQIGELSGGQLKRTFFARTLAQQPKVVLLDEPFAGVDVTSEKVIAEVIDELASTGVAVVLVHHDLAAARALCTHATLLGASGYVTGDIESVLTPDNLSAAYGLGIA